MNREEKKHGTSVQRAVRRVVAALDARPVPTGFDELDVVVVSSDRENRRTSRTETVRTQDRHSRLDFLARRRLRSSRIVLPHRNGSDDRRALA